MALFDREILVELLNRLAIKLHELGIRGGIRIVGGAAMALRFDDRRSTEDVDALMYPAEPIVVAAQELADELNLSVNWLNDAVKQYVPFVDEFEWQLLSATDSLHISIGSPEMLLAMKLRANRGRRDTSDVEVLLDALGIQSLNRVEEIYEKFHPQELLSESAIVRVQTWLSSNG